MKKMVLILLFVTAVSNAQWVQVSNGMGNRDVPSLVINGNYIFAGTWEYGVYLSTNNGGNWTQTSLNNQSVTSLAANGNRIFAASGAGVYSSTNNGTTWTLTSLNNPDVYSLMLNGNNIFAGTLHGVYLSSDNGTTWTQTSLNNREVVSFAVNGNTNIIFAGTHSYGIYLSTNNGTSWSQTSLNNQIVYSLALNGNRIFAGTANGVYLSTNNGGNWTQTSLNNRDVISLTINGNNIFAGDLNSNNVYISNDNGTSWTQRNEGLPNITVRAFCILNNYIFAGTWISGATHYSVYRRPLSEVIGIQPISNEIPNQFSLSQNYPNPFNPSTVISFSIGIPSGQLAVNSFASLKVFDVLGREVATLVNEQLYPGTYEVDWSATGGADKFSSGVYYYKLEASSGNEIKFVNSKKMVLVK